MRPNLWFFIRDRGTQNMSLQQVKIFKGVLKAWWYKAVSSYVLSLAEKTGWKSCIHIPDVIFFLLRYSDGHRILSICLWASAKGGRVRTAWGEQRGPDGPRCWAWVPTSASCVLFRVHLQPQGQKFVIAWSSLFVLFWRFLVIDTSKGANYV